MQIKNIDENTEANISTIQFVKYDFHLKLFLINQLRFLMQVKRQEIELIFDDEAKINCILHFMTLFLGLIIKTNV